MSDLIADAVEVRRVAKRLRTDLDVQHLTHEERTDLWVAAKRAANYLYSICKTLDPALLGEAGNTAGWKASDGTQLSVRSRFEVEVIDEDAYLAWAADRDVTPLEAKWTVPAEARKAIREALLEDGEAVPGVSAGQGNPFLSLGGGS